MPEGRMLKKWHSLSKALKLAVIKKDNLTCQRCGKKGIFTNHYGPRVIEEKRKRIYDYDGNYHEKEISLEFDHVIPRDKGGKTELKNLQLLCQGCNRSKGAKWRVDV